MYLKLDGQGPVYTQLIRAMKAAILAGDLVAGEKLPSTRRLARDFGVSRLTAISAYEQLRAEGYIQSKVGSGYFVNALQVNPALAAPDPGPVAPQSHYAGRIRMARGRGDWPTSRRRGLRFELQHGVHMIDPTLRVAWARELGHAAKNTRATRLLNPQGLLALREQIGLLLARRRGVRVSPDDVVIVNGTQHAFDLIARVLVDVGDTVVFEEPHYFGAWEAFAAHGARLLPVPIDEEGLVCAKLPKRAPKLVCVTPSHQYPAGPIMSLPRRLELLRYATDQRCWILEDDYDSNFRYASRPLAALREIDQGHRVIYVGTFSKLLFSTLRLGYLIPPAALRQDFIDARCMSDLGGSIIEQAALANFMRSGGFDRHLLRKDKDLRARRTTLLDALHKHAGDRVRIADFHTGSHVVVWLPHHSQAQFDALVEHAAKRGLGLYPVASHYHTPPATPGLLMGFDELTIPELREAIRIFGECLDLVAPKRRRSRVAKPATASPETPGPAD